MQRKLVLLFGLVLIIGLLISGVALAQDGTPPPSTPRPITSDDVNRIARQMYCPICENETLDACATAACAQWRAQIGQLLSEGQTESQIKQYFVERYGLDVLVEPPPTPRPITSDDVNHIARQMYCPICENEPLDVCRTAACAQWRAQIGQLLSQGQTESQIKQYFVKTFGLRVLAEPPASGVTLWLWVLPVVGLVIGGAYVVILMRRMRARNTASIKAAASAPKPSDAGDYAQRVERDLKNL